MSKKSKPYKVIKEYTLSHEIPPNAKFIYATKNTQGRIFFYYEVEIYE